MGIKYLKLVKTLLKVDFLYTEMVNLLFSRFCSYNLFGRKRPVSNLSVAELNALQNLTKYKNLVIQRANKCNTVVIINKNYYKTKIKDISDSIEFKKLEIGENNFLINSEKKLKDIIKPLYQKVSH